MTYNVFGGTLNLTQQLCVNTINNQVCGAVIVIVRVHSVDLLNVEHCQAAADPQTNTTDLCHDFACRLLSSMPTMVI